MSVGRGRFDGEAGNDMLLFSSSLRSDLRMFDEDIDGSVAHATMLGETGIITPEEADGLVAGLETIRKELADGTWQPPETAEDIHMAVEDRLIEQTGELGKKLHTARSRNDQVATDVRLWMVRRLDRLESGLVTLISNLLDRVESDGRTLIPGFTHLQRGQPINLGHHLLAHTWSLSRDRQRLADCRKRVDRSPLGACALAGTVHPINRVRTAELLGFAGVVENAMDAVAARDHLQEAVAVAAITMTHLSRMAEELVLWSTAEFALVRIDDRYVTGSSIMPQKRNPDAAELIRGKSARVHSDLQALLALTRSLPLAYNRDLQEDREPLFDAIETTIDCVGIMGKMWSGLAIDPERYETELKSDFSLATELADLLAEKGVPFRDAHGVAARIVHWCEERGVGLDALTTETAGEFHPLLAVDLSAWLDPRQAAERRASRGGTAWPEIKRQVDLLRLELKPEG